MFSRTRYKNIFIETKSINTTYIYINTVYVFINTSCIYKDKDYIYR